MIKCFSPEFRLSAVLCCAAVLLVSCNSTGESSREETEPPAETPTGSAAESTVNNWYSNGYVLETLKTYDAAGGLQDSARCEWASAGKRLSCLNDDPLNAEGYASDDTYNADGRIALSVWGSGGDFDRYRYMGGKLAEIVHGDFATGRVRGGRVYNWQGEVLLNFVDRDLQFNSDGDTGEVSESEVLRTTSVGWVDERLRTLEPARAEGAFKLGDQREVYVYDAQGGLQRIDLYWRDVSAGEWRFDEGLVYSFDNKGNIETMVSLQASGAVDARTVFTWQYVGEQVENGSLTIGRLP